MPSLSLSVISSGAPRLTFSTILTWEASSCARFAQLVYNLPRGCDTYVVVSPRIVCVDMVMQYLSGVDIIMCRFVCQKHFLCDTGTLPIFGLGARDLLLCGLTAAKARSLTLLLS